ncbi:MAG TPA: cob(I)yrinic acid a,c-diamide adenosyltransferase [Nitrospinae bacterium]|nr:cob(I)yrinic acid a,c-diamide adenosyltransferase [Nitrospinota bacterium]
MSDEYKEKAERIKKSYEKRQAAATEEKGLIIVHTGSGKGKSTAAFGMLLRAVHHGLRAGVVQFVKGAIASGEVEAMKSFGDAVEWHRMGEGFSWITQDQELDRRAAEKAWAKSKELMNRPDIGMVILDEINVAVRLKQLDLEEVLEALRGKREMIHVVLTGRGAKDELIELADLVTEMKMVKHPYRAGIKAQKGVEF